jgi:branched-chain amino acid transport system ATP-binding protein
MSYLVAEGISRRFYGFFALQDVSLSIAPSERHALIGPNGAGKSTLFNILAGEIPASSGTVRLDGQDITATPLHRRAQAGIARTFQRNNLFTEKSVFENVRLAVQAHERAAWSLFRTPTQYPKINATANEILDTLSLSHLSARMAGELSYGDQRKVELAVALAGRPKVLLIDEPAAGMARGETTEMVKVLAALPRTIALVIIEHDMDVVSALADRVTVLQNGRIIAAGDWHTIRQDADVQRAYIGGRKH